MEWQKWYNEMDGKYHIKDFESEVDNMLSITWVFGPFFSFLFLWAGVKFWLQHDHGLLFYLPMFIAVLMISCPFILSIWLKRRLKARVVPPHALVFAKRYPIPYSILGKLVAVTVDESVTANCLPAHKYFVPYHQQQIHFVDVCVDKTSCFKYKLTCCIECGGSVEDMLVYLIIGGSFWVRCVVGYYCLFHRVEDGETGIAVFKEYLDKRLKNGCARVLSVSIELISK